MSNLGDFKRGLCALAQATGGLATVHQLTDTFAFYDKATADAMAADATANTLIWMNPFDFALVITGAKVAPASTIATNETDFVTVTIKVDDGAAGTPAVAASWVSNAAGTGSWATGVAKSATLTAANCVVPVGGCLWFNIAKGGSGKIVPISKYLVRMQRAE